MTATHEIVTVREPVCGTVEAWSEADQERAADEMLELLPADSPITWAMGSFIRMRDEARACAAADDSEGGRSGGS